MPLNNLSLNPRFSHIENALEIFRIQNGTWAPNQANINAINAHLLAELPPAIIDAAYLTRIIEASNNANGGGARPDTVGVVESLRTPVALMDRDLLVDAQQQALRWAIEAANQTQSRILPLYRIPSHYSHIRDVLIAFAIQNGVWAPDNPNVAAIIDLLKANPLGANITHAQLTALVTAADAVGAGVKANTADVVELRTPTAINDAPAAAVNAQKAAMAAAIAIADPIQTRIQPLYAIPQQYAHVRDALVAFAIQNGVWAPDNLSVAAIIAHLKANPLGANITHAQLTALVTAADAVGAGVIANTAAVVELRTPTAINDAPAAAVNAQKAAMAAAIAIADPIQTRIQPLYAIPQQYAHVRDALVAFAIQNGVWAPNGVSVAAIIAHLKANPLEANLTHVELTALVNAADAVVGAGVRADTAPAPALRTPTAINNAPAAPAVNAQKAAMAAAIAIADPIQTRIQHLYAIPQQYAHVRDALVAFAIQNGVWAPDNLSVAAIIAHLKANPLGANLTHVELTALVNAADAVGAGVKANTAAVGELHTPTAINDAPAAPAVNAQKAAMAAAIAIADSLQTKIDPLHEITLRELQVALEIHALRNPGFGPTEPQVIALNRALANLPPGADDAAINGAIRSVWTTFAANFMSTNPARDAIVTEFRLAPLSKIIHPFRALLEEHARHIEDFKPNNTDVQRFNIEINKLNLLGAANAEQIDTVIQSIWMGKPGIPVNNYFRTHAQNATILNQQIRLAPLSKIVLPELREAFQAWAAKTPGFVTTPVQIDQMNHNLAQDMPLKDAILRVFPADIAHPHNPPADFIDNHVNKVALINEHRTSRLTQDLQAKVTEISKSPVESHPALMRVVQQLPVDKRDDLLKSNKLNQLLAARTEFALLAAARDCGFDGASLTKDTAKELIDENLRNRAFQKLGNSKIAEILGGFPIDRARVRALNTVITQPPGKAYNDFVEELFSESALDNAHKEKFKAAFGLPSPAGMAATPIQTAVEKQNRLNHELHVKYNANLTPDGKTIEYGKEAALLALARLEKTGDALASAEIDQLVDQITSTNFLKTTVRNTNPPITIETLLSRKTTDGEPLLKDMYDGIRQQYNRDNLRDTLQVGYTLNRQTPKIEAIEKSMAAFKKGHAEFKEHAKLGETFDEQTKKGLANLNGLHPMAWLDPANEHIAKTYASILLPEFEAMNRLCEDACMGLQSNLVELERLEASLSADSELNALGMIDKRKVKKLGERIRTQKTEVQALLAIYENTHALLNGDPRIPLGPNPPFADKIKSQGVLNVLKAAKELKALSQPELEAMKPDLDHSISGFVEVKNTDVAATVAAQSAQVKAMQVHAGVALAVNDEVAEVNRLFANTGQLQEGHARVHTVLTEHSFAGRPAVGANAAILPAVYACIYSEQVGKPRTIPTSNGPTAVQAHKMKVEAFPSAPTGVALTPVEQQALDAAQVEASMKLAIERVKNLGVSSKVTINGGGNPANDREVAMFWAALMLIRKAYPDHRFTIQITGSNFQPPADMNTNQVTRLFTQGPSEVIVDNYLEAMRPYFAQLYGNTTKQIAALQESKDSFLDLKSKLRNTIVQEGTNELLNQGPTRRGGG